MSRLVLLLESFAGLQQTDKISHPPSLAPIRLLDDQTGSLFPAKRLLRLLANLAEFERALASLAVSGKRTRWIGSEK